jgi:hypothetical protein
MTRKENIKYQIASHSNFFRLSDDKHAEMKVDEILELYSVYAAVNVNSVPPWSGGRRVFDIELMANPEEPNIFSTSIFWRTHSNYAS